MNVFPQLSTGASGQYPILKRRTARTIRNLCQDGHEIKIADPAGGSVEWQLRFGKLTDEEVASIEQFHESVEGSLSEFTFLDPLDNLLLWSENLDNPAWQKDPQLQLTAGSGDPFGGNRGTNISNPTGSPLQIQQRLNAPGWFHYALSVYAKGDGITLMRAGERRSYATGSRWERLVLTGKSDTADEFAWFGLEIAAGSSVDIFGMQAEAQIGASGYKKTTSTGGLYQKARLKNDTLEVTTDGPGQHSCVINVIYVNRI